MVRGAVDLLAGPLNQIPVAMTRAKRHLVGGINPDVCHALTVVILVHYRRLIDSAAWWVIFEEVDDMVRGECGC